MIQDISFWQNFTFWQKVLGVECLEVEAEFKVCVTYFEEDYGVDEWCIEEENIEFTMTDEDGSAPIGVIFKPGTGEWKAAADELTRMGGKDMRGLNPRISDVIAEKVRELSW